MGGGGPASGFAEEGAGLDVGHEVLVWSSVHDARCVGSRAVRDWHVGGMCSLAFPRFASKCQGEWAEQVRESCGSLTDRSNKTQRSRVHCKSVAAAGPIALWQGDADRRLVEGENRKRAGS